MSVKKLLLLVFINSLVLTGCQPSLPPPTSPPLTTQPTIPLTQPTQKSSLSATAIIEPTSIASPSPTSRATMLELGKPAWLGRGSLVGAAFLPGAQEIALAWGSGVSLHEVADGKEVWFQSTPANIISFDMHPQGRAFAALLSDGSLMTFATHDGAPQLFESIPANAYWGDTAWSPDGKTIALQYISNRNYPIHLLDPATGQLSEVPESRTREGTPPHLEWSPDGTAISLAFLGSECPRFIDIITGEDQVTLGTPGQCYLLTGLLFLADGRMAASSWKNSGVDILSYPDLESLMILEPAPNLLSGGLTMFPAVTSSLFIDPDELWIASRGGYEPCFCGNPSDQPYHPLVVWDLSSGKIQAQLERGLYPLSELHRLAAAFDRDEVVMLYENGVITHWAFTEPGSEEYLSAQVPVLPVSAWSLRWSADGSHLAFNGQYGGVGIYATTSGQLVRYFDPPLESPALSPDGSLVSLFDPDQQLEYIYELPSSRLIHKLPATPLLMGAAFSPDGNYLAYALNTSVILFELSSGEVIELDTSTAARMNENMRLTRLLWSPDMQALVTMLSEANPGSGGHGEILLWQRLPDASFKLVHQVPNVRADYTLANLELAAFNPSGTRVALESFPKNEAGQITLVVYDLTERKILRSFPDYHLGAWINDDEMLAAEAQYDTRITRFNVVTGAMETGSGREMGDNAYAPGGQFFARSANPPVRGVTIHSWKSNAILAVAEHQALNLTDYSWSPDGSWLASVGGDGTLLIWRVSLP